MKIVEGVTPEKFRDEIRPASVPAVLKGLAADWPAVREGLQSTRAIADYLRRFDQGRPVETIFGSPEIEGKFFYNEKLDGLNFERRPEAIAASVDRILAAAEQERPPSIYVQSVPIRDCLPAFSQENRLGIVDPSVSPRIWIGNRLTVQTHFDLSENVACVVAGRRRFTLFPPEQTPNLYPGPFELTLAGPPVSMVRLEDPDLGRYPRFGEALEHGLVADLEPGDAIYIPYFWWHHVQTLDDLNVLVNYWWNDAQADLGSPFDALLHAILAIRDMPPSQRTAWKVMFEHYAFGENGDPVEHLPPQARGALGAHDPRMRQQIRMMLLNAIARQAGIRPPPRQG
ncbi:MAG TPA: cupin-like domain-containing protein [Woeseiaceae bacterium]|nr:cupin-like domain-containing protein [Woeseiaceae bacterium]